MEMLTIYLIIMLILSVSIVACVPQRGITRKLLHPLGMFISFYIFVHFFEPVLQAIYHVGRFSYFTDINSEDFIVYSTLISFSYLVVVIFSFILFGIPRVPFEQISLAIRSPASRRVELSVQLFCTIAFFIGAAFTIKLYFSFSDNLAEYMSDRINLLSGLGYLIKLSSFCTPLAILLFCKSLIGKRKYELGSLFLLIGSMLFLGMMIGSRSSALILIIFVGLASLYSKPGKSMIYPLSILMLLILFGVFLQQVRTNMKIGGDVQMVRGIDTASIVSEMHHSFGHTELIAYVLENTNNFDYLYGKSYAAGLLSFVPRGFWSDKPVGAGPVLANLVAPGSYELGRNRNNSSLTTGMVLESILNWGIFGVPIIAVLHGALLAYTTKFSKKVKNRIDFILYLLLLQFSAVLLVNAEFLGAYSGFMFLFFTLSLLRRVTNASDNGYIQKDQK